MIRYVSKSVVMEHVFLILQVSFFSPSLFPAHRKMCCQAQVHVCINSLQVYLLNVVNQVTTPLLR